jgi:hypothetical protein
MSTVEISGLTHPGYPSAAARKKYIDDISGNCRYRFRSSSNNWNFISSQKISSGTILTNDFTTYGDMISGLTQPTFNSGAVNKKYADIKFKSSSGNWVFASSQKISGGTIKNTTLYTSLITDSDRLTYPNTIKFSNDEMKFSVYDKHMIDFAGDDNRIHIRSGSIWGHLNSTTLGYMFNPSQGLYINIPNTYSSPYKLAVVGTISGSNYIGVRISGAKDINNWNSHSWHNSGIQWNETTNKWIAKPSSGTGGGSTLDSMTDVTITTPLSGQVLTYMQNTAQWVNRYPSMTYNVANVLISAGTNLNIARFNTGTGKNCYLWQASCCGSGGIGISGLKIQLLQSTTNKYWTSSQIVQQGNPLTKATGDIEIRMMYSGGGILTGKKYGSSFMNVSVW